MLKSLLGCAWTDCKKDREVFGYIIYSQNEDLIKGWVHNYGCTVCRAHISHANSTQHSCAPPCINPKSTVKMTYSLDIYWVRIGDDGDRGGRGRMGGERSEGGEGKRLNT